MKTLKFKDAFAQMKQEQKAPLLILVPFYSGVGLHAHGSPQKRKDDLIKCLTSLQGQGDIIVATATREDYDYVSKLSLDIKTMQIDCPPEHIPYALVRVMQKSTGVYSFVLLTEADMVHEKGLFHIAQSLSPGQALMPYRISNGKIETPTGPKAHHQYISGGWLVDHGTFKALKFSTSIPWPLKEITTFSVVDQCQILRHKKFTAINLSNEKEKGEGK
jgi:hypothetical protein